MKRKRSSVSHSSAIVLVEILKIYTFFVKTYESNLFNLLGTRGPCDGEGGKTPKCQKTCEDGYNVPYEKDKHFGKKSYSLQKNANEIRQEIFENGPVEGAFTVYEDLLSYKSGKHFFVSSLF